MKKIILSIIVLGFHKISFCQEDSIKNEILNYKDTTLDLILHGRQLLAQKLAEGDFKKVKEIKDFILKETVFKNIPQFSYYEYWLILFWTKEYDELINSVLNFETDTLFRWRNQYYFHDQLGEKLSWQSFLSKSVLNLNIENANLEPEKTTFLQLFLDYLTRDKSNNQDSLNIKGDNFYKNFPLSKLNYFVIKYIEVKYKTSKWGFGLEIFLGYDSFNGKLPDYFNDCIGIGLTFDITYKKFCSYLRGNLGFSKTKSDISFDSIIWKKNSHADLGIFEASFGYPAFDKKNLKIVPFIGIASSGIDASTSDKNKFPEYDKVGVHYATTYNFGINADIKLGIESYLFFRIRYAFNIPNFNDKFNGYIHYFTIGIGSFGRRIKRIYN